MGPSSIRGLGHLEGIDPVKRAQRLAVIRAVTNIGEDLLGKAQRDAPIEEGTLRGSGDVDIELDANAVWATVSFNTVYAARQHEELDWVHPKGGKAKYLEANLQADQSRYERILGLAVANATPRS